MPTNEVFEFADRLSVVVTNPVAPAAGGPCRYGVATGVAYSAAGAGGNTALEATVDFGLRVWTLAVTDTVGGSIALGATLFYTDGAPGAISNNPAGVFFGFALATVGVGATASIRVLHVPSPGSGTIGAGTIATANIAAGAISADAPGRALFAANVFDAATVLAKFASDSVTNAVLLKAVLDGAFQADAGTRALFADGIWTEAKLASAATNGLGSYRVARATFDPSTTAGERTQAAHSLTTTLPDNAIVIGGFVDVITTFTSGGADAATIALSVEGANDIVSALAISNGGNIWDAGLHPIVPKANTPESTGVKTTQARAITATVAGGQDLTAGKLIVFLHYVVSD